MCTGMFSRGMDGDRSRGGYPSHPRPYLGINAMSLWQHAPDGRSLGGPIDLYQSDEKLGWRSARLEEPEKINEKTEVDRVVDDCRRGYVKIETGSGPDGALTKANIPPYLPPISTICQEP